LAGAVDLSGLKQRAQQNTSASGPAGRATSGAAGQVEVTEANFEDEVLVRSDEVPVVVVLWSPRSDACVELVETLSGLAAEDTGRKRRNGRRGRGQRDERQVNRARCLDAGQPGPARRLNNVRF